MILITCEPSRGGFVCTFMSVYTPSVIQKKVEQNSADSFQDLQRWDSEGIPADKHVLQTSPAEIEAFKPRHDFTGMEKRCSDRKRPFAMWRISTSAVCARHHAYARETDNLIGWFTIPRRPGKGFSPFRSRRSAGDELRGNYGGCVARLG